MDTHLCQIELRLNRLLGFNGFTDIQLNTESAKYQGCFLF